jgi:hypothetical protein
MEKQTATAAAQTSERKTAQTSEEISLELYNLLSQPLQTGGYKPDSPCTIQKEVVKDGKIVLQNFAGRNFVPYPPVNQVLMRLNKVLGALNWDASYEPAEESNSVYCTITIRYRGITTSRSAVGSYDTHQAVLDKKPGNKIKATQSNAFVRAARQFGVGEYENSLPAMSLREGPVRGSYLDNSNRLLPDAAAAGAYLAGQRQDELYLFALINSIRPELRDAVFPALSSVVMMFRQGGQTEKETEKKQADANSKN